MVRIELAGQQFSRLTVLRAAGLAANRLMRWECRCVCGAIRVVTGHNLRRGRTKSCGCLIREMSVYNLRTPDVVDVTGQRFGKLMVLHRVASLHHEARWRCLCDCGGTIDVRGSSLRKGDTKSCGCLRREAKWKHGHKAAGQKSPTYTSWYNMKRRCLDKNHMNFRYYGGRGITVCERWLAFAPFLEDMGERMPWLTLDRINVNGNYEPSNCRWATIAEQSMNKRRTCHELETVPRSRP